MKISLEPKPNSRRSGTHFANPTQGAQHHYHCHPQDAYCNPVLPDCILLMTMCILSITKCILATYCNRVGYFLTPKVHPIPMCIFCDNGVMHGWFHIVCDLITLQGGSCQCQDTPCWYQCAPCNWQGACNYYHHFHDGVWWCFVVYQTITFLCKQIPKHNTHIISLLLLLLHKFSPHDFLCVD